MAESPWILDVEEADFERVVIEGSRRQPVIVDFWAPWCPPCRLLSPILEKLIAERTGQVILAKVNIDHAQGLAARYRVEGIPTVKAFRDGQTVLEFIGLMPEPHLRQFLDQVMPSEADHLARQGREQEKTNPLEAERLYRQALEKKKDHEEAVLGLARILIDRGEETEASELLDRVGPGSDQGAEAERLSALLQIRQQSRGLPDEKSLRARLAEKPDNAQARYELGCVLASTGKNAEALEVLLAAAEKDPKLAADKVRPAMVNIFQIIGVRSELADSYRDKLARLLY